MEHQTNSRPFAMKELARSAIPGVLEPGIGGRSDRTSRSGGVYGARYLGGFRQANVRFSHNQTRAPPVSLICT